MKTYQRAELIYGFTTLCLGTIIILLEFFGPVVYHSTAQPSSLAQEIGISRAILYILFFEIPFIAIAIGSYLDTRPQEFAGRRLGKNIIIIAVILLSVLIIISLASIGLWLIAPLITAILTLVQANRRQTEPA